MKVVRGPVARVKIPGETTSLACFERFLIKTLSGWSCPNGKARDKLPWCQVETPAQVQNGQYSNESNNAIPEVSGSSITIQLIDTIIKKAGQKARGFCDVGKVHTLRGKHYEGTITYSQAVVSRFLQGALNKIYTTIYDGLITHTSLLCERPIDTGMSSIQNKHDSLMARAHMKYGVSPR